MRAKTYEDVFRERSGESMLGSLPPHHSRPPRVSPPHSRAGRKRKTTRMRRSGERRDEADAGGKKARRCGSTRAGVIRRSESRWALNFSKVIAPLQDDEKTTAPLFVGERWSGEDEEVERVVTGRGNWMREWRGGVCNKRAQGGWLTLEKWGAVMTAVPRPTPPPGLRAHPVKKKPGWFG
jgi:hypothetical protein